MPHDMAAGWFDEHQQPPHVAYIIYISAVIFFKITVALTNNISV